MLGISPPGKMDSTITFKLYHKHRTHMHVLSLCVVTSNLANAFCPSICRLNCFFVSWTGQYPDCIKQRCHPSFHVTNYLGCLTTCIRLSLIFYPINTVLRIDMASTCIPFLPTYSSMRQRTWWSTFCNSTGDIDQFPEVLGLCLWISQRRGVIMIITMMRWPLVKKPFLETLSTNEVALWEPLRRLI